jgi:hypothetical protein
MRWDDEDYEVTRRRVYVPLILIVPQRGYEAGSCPTVRRALRYRTVQGRSDGKRRVQDGRRTLYKCGQGGQVFSVVQHGGIGLRGGGSGVEWDVCS